MQRRAHGRRSVPDVLTGMVLVALASSCKDGAIDPDANLQFSDWGPVVNLGAVVNSASADLGPAISPDGLALYFYSSRAGGAGGNDIWAARRANRNAPWEAPRNLGPLINSSAADIVPSFSPDGRQLYITSNRASGIGDYDIWVSTRVDVNGPVLTNLDLYVSTLNGNVFGTPVALAELNTTDGSEAHATVRRDGREIFFYSTRTGGAGLTDIYVSTRQTADGPWTAPINVTAWNTATNDLHPALDRDALTIYFGSDRPGGSGGNDLYMATRTRTN